MGEDCCGKVVVEINVEMDREMLAVVEVEAEEGEVIDMGMVEAEVMVVVVETKEMVVMLAVVMLAVVCGGG